MLSRRELMGGALGASALLWAEQAEAQMPVPAPDPQEVKLRAYLNMRPVFERFVFTGETFPKLKLEPANAVGDYLGRFEVKTTFYDFQGRPVKTATRPGPYAALVDIVPASGRPSRRLVTLYRLAQTSPTKDIEMFATAAGLKAGTIAPQTDLITATCKERDWQALAEDGRVARLLAGLYFAPSFTLKEQSTGIRDLDGLNASLLPQSSDADSSTTNDVASAPRKNVDAFAAERQWWVTLKRKWSGLDKSHPHVAFGPDTVSGKPATVLRSGTLADAGMRPDTGEKIDAVLKMWVADTDQAFAAIVVRHGVIAFHRAYGTREGQPMTLTTQSWMASITKPMCATLMMMLVDRGVLGLDDPIEKYLPQLRGISVSTPITIRHLYTHTSGLDKWPGWSDELPDMEDQLADCYAAVKVGKVWSYGGQGNSIGAKIIETLSGEALPLAYLRHLHGPLGNIHTDVVGAHADAYSIPLDIARFGQMMLNRGAYGRLRFLRPETFAQMLPQKLTITLGPNAEKTFGVGLDGQPDNFGHGAASAATFHVEPKRDLVVIMTRNSIGTNYDKYNGKFWQAINESII